MALFRKAHAGNIYILDCVASEEVLIERKVARRRRFRHGGEQISASRGKPSGLEATGQNLDQESQPWAGSGASAETPTVPQGAAELRSSRGPSD